MKEKIIVDKVYSRPKKGAASVPKLLKFQNGKITRISKDTTQYFNVMNNKTKGKEAVVVVKEQIYRGNVETHESNDSYICVHNKNTNTVRIIPIENVRLNNDVYNVLADNIVPRTQQADNARENLLRQFGGRNAMRYIANRQQMQVNIETVRDELQATAMEANGIDGVENLETSRNYLEDIRPKFNKETTNLREVYKIDDIIPNDLLERLDEEAKFIYGSDLSKIPITSEFLLKRLREIQESTQSAQGFLRIKIILYMDALLSLIKTRARSLEKEELSRVTEKVEKDVRFRFSDPNGKKRFSRSVFSSEKALCYFIVLAIISTDSLQVQLSELAKELCVPISKVLKFAQVVNARAKSKTDILALNLPSKVPELSSGRKKTKKF